MRKEILVPYIVTIIGTLFLGMSIAVCYHAEKYILSILSGIGFIICLTMYFKIVKYISKGGIK